MNFEGSGRGVKQVLPTTPFPQFAAGTEENHDRPLRCPRRDLNSEHTENQSQKFVAETHCAI